MDVQRGRDVQLEEQHPAVPWTCFQHERASIEQINSWFPDDSYGVGIVTGAISGIFVVDEDSGPGKPGADTLYDLQMRHGDLPATVTAITVGGDRHFLFRHPGGTRIKTGKDVLGRGIDVRGDGGFIVAPPSRHASGRQYTWATDLSPDEVTIAAAPAWLIDMVREGARGQWRTSGRLQTRVQAGPFATTLASSSTDAMVTC